MAAARVWPPRIFSKLPNELGRQIVQEGFDRPVYAVMVDECPAPDVQRSGPEDDIWFRDDLDRPTRLPPMPAIAHASQLTLSETNVYLPEATRTYPIPGGHIGYCVNIPNLRSVDCPIVRVPSYIGTDDGNPPRILRFQHPERIHRIALSLGTEEQMEDPARKLNGDSDNGDLPPWWDNILGGLHHLREVFIVPPKEETDEDGEYDEDVFDDDRWYAVRVQYRDVPPREDQLLHRLGVVIDEHDADVTEDVAPEEAVALRDSLAAYLAARPAGWWAGGRPAPQASIKTMVGPFIMWERQALGYAFTLGATAAGGN